jgi:hypothetical protein
MRQKLLFLPSLFLFASAWAAEPLLPDLITKADTLNDRELDFETQPGRVLLRFSNAVGNVGYGPLEIRGGNAGASTQEVVQRIYLSDQSFVDRRAGTFSFHAEHSHVHFDSFASYQLRRVTPGNGIGPVVAESAKVSFCLQDSEAVSANKSGIFEDRYKFCGNDQQGISLGFADVYRKSLPGQFIDITAVPAGIYWLQSTADPENRILESNESNNSAQILLEVRRGSPSSTVSARR